MPQLLEWEKNLHLMLGEVQALQTYIKGCHLHLSCLTVCQHWMQLDRHPFHLDPAPFSSFGKGWGSTWRDYGSKGGFLMHQVMWKGYWGSNMKPCLNLSPRSGIRM
ncbi:unnamed protein product [Staurois parvus]|uniref:Uncharacterized protein n=1 Tax=Staurois parvus TaxID=386267 RepID=A0ABN9GUJ2_9NEOB|nr:unnamed protein product [Staurois parvus]